MKTKVSFIITLIFLLSQHSCKLSKQKPLPPEKQLDSFESKIDKPFIDRVSVMPDVFRSYLVKMDKTDSYSDYKPSHEDLQLFRNSYDVIPAEFKRVLEKKVIAVYFVNNFKGGGLTDYIYDNENNMYFIMLFNPETLKKSMTEWIRYRDNSPFNNIQKGFEIRSELSGKYKAIYQVMVHESCHVYDYMYHVTPYVEPDMISSDREVMSKESIFVSNVWFNYSLPVERYDFPYRNKIHAYGLGDTIDMKKAIEIYSRR